VEPALAVNGPSVVAEIIDGEAVIMNLASGHYFSAQGSGAEIWRGIEARLGRSGIAAMLAELYECDRVELDRAVGIFVAELLERRLVVEDMHREAAARVPELVRLSPLGAQARKAFMAPVLNTYSDMEDLLLLDPIHDVDDTGWPMPKSTDAKPT
jgi:hypothetical protein